MNYRLMEGKPSFWSTSQSNFSSLAQTYACKEEGEVQKSNKLLIIKNIMDVS